MENAKTAFEELMKPEDVAQKLNIGKSTVYHLAQRGALPAVKIGGSLRFRPESLTTYLRGLETKVKRAA